jgi:hypothetical protein
MIRRPLRSCYPQQGFINATRIWLLSTGYSQWLLGCGNLQPDIITNNQDIVILNRKSSMTTRIWLSSGTHHQGLQGAIVDSYQEWLSTGNTVLYLQYDRTSPETTKINHWQGSWDCHQNMFSFSHGLTIFTNGHW